MTHWQVICFQISHPYSWNSPKHFLYIQSFSSHLYSSGTTQWDSLQFTLLKQQDYRGEHTWFSNNLDICWCLSNICWSSLIFVWYLLIFVSFLFIFIFVKGYQKTRQKWKRGWSGRFGFSRRRSRRRAASPPAQNIGLWRQPPFVVI